jgi:DNA-binding MarR family transcriptional regulator
MNKRSERLDELLDVFDKGYSLCAQYDEIPHQYGEEVLYQSEMHFLQAVGNTGDITITTISQQLGKTTSACSQMVRILKKITSWIQIAPHTSNTSIFLCY